MSLDSSEFQNPLFQVLRRRPCPCRYFTTVFAIALVLVTVTIYLDVICQHFICLTMLFQGHVTSDFFPDRASFLQHCTLIF